MKNINFPIVNTKTDSNKEYDLNDPNSRKGYFEAKVGKEIAELKEYFKTNTFIAYMLGKKQAGKGTYSKLFGEIFGADNIKHLSVGDIVRDTDNIKVDAKAKAELIEYMSKNYRGYIPIEKALEFFTNRSTKTLLPTEFIIALIKREIEKNQGKVLFIDGFPRDLDQVSYSLYFRDLVNYRDDPDLFVIIDVPEQVIDERIKLRRVCPKCKTSRNLSAFPTSVIKYDEEAKEYYLVCDNPDCEPTKMVGKEGDELGIESIRERTELDDKLIRKALELHGIPKVLLRNSIPIAEMDKYADKYEMTTISTYEYDEKSKKVLKEDVLWEIVDDNGVPSYSYKAAPVVIALIKGLYDVLIVGKQA